MLAARHERVLTHYSTHVDDDDNKAGREPNEDTDEAVANKVAAQPEPKPEPEPSGEGLLGNSDRQQSQDIGDKPEPAAEADVEEGADLADRVKGGGGADAEAEPRPSG